MLARSHNIQKVPVVVAAFAVGLWHHQTPRSVLGTMTALFRVALSHSLVQTLLPDALKRPHGLKYPVAAGIDAAVFDKFSIRNAGGLMVDDEPGEQINMTNRASL
eukprot:2248971-Pleurochrysis_carterae.AAC.1